jgi:hypothetical protein
MEYFDIVLALARIAVDSGGEYATQQVKRLCDALVQSDADQAARLSLVLSRAPVVMEEVHPAGAAARCQLLSEPLSSSNPMPNETFWP